MAVALYARVSTSRQAEKDLSIPDQLRQMREYCKAQNLPVAFEYIEAGATATDDRRPVFQQMIADAGQDPAPYEAIIVHSRSRFFRDLFEFLGYERRLKRAGVRLISITQQTADDPAGEMASKIFSLFDEYQSKENGSTPCGRCRRTRARASATARAPTSALERWNHRRSATRASARSAWPSMRTRQRSCAASSRSISPATTAQRWGARASPIS